MVSERGAALLLVLVTIVMLTALVLEFDRFTRTDLRAAGNFRDGVQAGLLAKAGVEAGRGFLRDDAVRSATYDGLDELWARLPAAPVGDGVITVVIEDESGKLNPNHLVAGPAAQKVPAKIAQMKRLLDVVGVDTRLADAMVDWVDPDANPEPGGAEDSYYGGLDPPYRARNGPFQSVSELRLLRGVTEDIYRKLSPHLTVDTPPSGRININTAAPSVLQALDARVSPALAGRIVQARPFRKLDDLDKVAGMEQIARELRLPGHAYEVRSDTFLILSRGQIHGTSRLVRASVERVRSLGLVPTVRLLSWRMETDDPSPPLFSAQINP